MLFAVLVAAAACAEPTGAVPTPRTAAVPQASTPSPPPTTVTVPDLVYHKLEFAKIDAKDAGLTVKVVKWKTTMDWQPDTILSQKPKPGSQADPGTRITVTVTKLPDCHPSYPDVCLAPRGPDLDCKDVDGPFRVVGEDAYRLDSNDDGVACGRRD